jgi:ring-1,2-phenylacetyl-CoA epoxidase subunit PaaA
VIDCPFPARFDEERREWLLDRGSISWDEVLARWRRRGPMNDDYVATLQRGYQTTSLRRAGPGAPATATPGAPRGATA